MGLPLLRPILRPLTRFLIGVIAIPLFRLFLKRVVRLDQLDAELEKDLEQWFRGCLLLLVATRNMEETLFGWVDQLWQGDYHWMMMGFRILLAIGVVEAMPDLFLKEVRKRTRERLLPAFRNVCRIVAAELGDDAAVQGAAAWAREIAEKKID